MRLTLWSWYWLAWIIAFIAPELVFVFTYRRATLSETVWALWCCICRSAWPGYERR